MIIKKIKLNNIRSYENIEIEFPLGNTVLAGDIGTGKTSILLAIEFALFGLQPGQRGSSLLRNGADEGFVNLKIEIDEDIIEVERGLKRGKTVNQSYAKIILNNEEKEMSITELKNKVLELLNYPKEFAKKTNLLYRFTVYTPQEEMKQIILEMPEIRLNTLRHIFGIDKYRRIRENTQLFAINLRESIREKEGQIKDLEEIRKNLTQKTQNIEDIEKNIIITEEELKNKIEKRKQAEKELEKVEEKIKEKEKYEIEVEKTKIMFLSKREFLQNTEKEILKLNQEIEEARKLKFEESEFKENEKQIKDKEAEGEKLNNLYFQILSKIQSLKTKISEQEKLKEQISKLELCPTCLQNVNEDYKKIIIRKADEETENCKKLVLGLEKEKSKTIENINILKQELLNTRKKLNELNILKMKLQNLEEKSKKIQELENSKKANEKDISLLEKQMLSLKESISLMKKYDILYEQKEKELNESELGEREKELELASIKKEKEMLLRQIAEINKEINKKENVKKKLHEATELEDWLSNSFLNIISFTERNIMLKLREDFSKLFNEWFNVLVPENFTVRLDEDFTPIIEQQDFSLDYSFLSGGERTAIALAYRLSLNQIINSLLSRIKTKDLVILDEPTDGFSEQQLDKMRDVLNELKVKQLIIVSHESKIESFVENIIKFTKEAGITKVEA